MKRFFVFHDYDYCENDGLIAPKTTYNHVGFKEFKSKRGALRFINNTLRGEGVSLTETTWRLIEGRELSLRETQRIIEVTAD